MYMRVKSTFYTKGERRSIVARYTNGGISIHKTLTMLGVNMEAALVERIG
jgi:hypothetical protein